jgi:hypothetical protein
MRCAAGLETSQDEIDGRLGDCSGVVHPLPTGGNGNDDEHSDLDDTTTAGGIKNDGTSATPSASSFFDSTSNLAVVAGVVVVLLAVLGGVVCFVAKQRGPQLPQRHDVGAGGDGDRMSTSYSNPVYEHVFTRQQIEQRQELSRNSNGNGSSNLPVHLVKRQAGTVAPSAAAAQQFYEQLPSVDVATDDYLDVTASLTTGEPDRSNGLERPTAHSVAAEPPRPLPSKSNSQPPVPGKVDSNPSLPSNVDSNLSLPSTVDSNLSLPSNVDSRPAAPLPASAGDGKLSPIKAAPTVALPVEDSATASDGGTGGNAAGFPGEAASISATGASIV